MMKKLYHRGAPCHPPVVNGITFAPSEEHPDYHVGEGTEEQIKCFEGVPQFFDHPDSDPALAVQVATSTAQPEQAPDYTAEIGRLTTENAKLKEQVVDLTAKVDTLAVENTALREQIAGLEAEDEGEDGATEDGVTDLDALDAEVKALEAKKAAGQTSKTENMQLGKLKKKLDAALKK